jgi:hypothetical protein
MTWMLFRWPLKIGLLLLACSCGPILTASRPNGGLVFDSNDNDALVVLYVTPRTGVIIVGGGCDEHGWSKNHFTTRQHFWSADGYIVVKATPTQGKEAYAVVAVRPERFTRFEDEKPYTYATVLWGRFLFDPGTFSLLALGVIGGVVSGAQGGPIDWGEEDKGQFAYSPGAGADLPTFTAAPGQVGYVGALRVEASQRNGAKAPPKNIAITPICSPEDVAAAAQFVAARYPNVHVPVTYRPLQLATRDEAGND